MSSTFSGTQEYMAMEKLGQLRASDEWDLIVVDTPPSRSALDFLDAPARLSRFLDGRMLRMLLAPARAGGRSVFSLVTASFGMFSRVGAEDPRRPVADRPVGFRRGAGLDVRRVPAAGRRRRTGSCRTRRRRSCWSRRRSADAVREAAYFARAAGRGADAARRAGAQPGASGGGRAVRASRA